MQTQVYRIAHTDQFSSPSPSLNSPAWASADRVRGNTRTGGAAAKKHYQSREHMAAMRAKRAYYDEACEVYQLRLFRES